MPSESQLAIFYSYLWGKNVVQNNAYYEADNEYYHCFLLEIKKWGNPKTPP